MSVLKDVEKRLVEAEQGVTDLVRRLERLGSLEQSLDAAGRGLGETSANIDKFATEAETAAKSLNEVLATLRQAVEFLQRSDPAQTHEAITKIGAQLESVSGQAAKIESVAAELRERFLSDIPEVSETLATEIKNARDTASTVVKAGNHETIEAIQEVARRLAHEQASGIHALKRIGYIILAVLLALFVLVAYSL